jgi:hypothetical protein
LLIVQIPRYLMYQQYFASIEDTWVKPCLPFSPSII